MTTHRTIRYSESFKLKVVSELESGKLPSIEAARRRYGIGGAITVQKWLRRFGKSDSLGKVVHVRTPDERDELEKLKEENRRLRDLVADMAVQQRVDEAYFKIACDAAGIEDREAFKKKLAAKPPIAPSNPPRKRK